MAMSRRSTDRIVVHMSETNPNVPTSAAQIRAFHMAKPPRGRGWTDIGYHWYIRRDGTVEDGRDVNGIGAHAEGWNGTSIGICLEGGAGAKATDQFADHFTPAQDAALRTLIGQMMELYGPLDVYGHKDCPSCAPEKQCPGFNAQTWYAGGAA